MILRLRCERAFDSWFLTCWAISDHSACCRGGTSATHNPRNAELNFRENRMWALVIGMWHCLLLPTVWLSAFYFGLQLNGFFCFFKTWIRDLLNCCLWALLLHYEGTNCCFRTCNDKGLNGWMDKLTGEFWHFMRTLDAHRRLNLLRLPSLLFNELEMGLNNPLLYRFLFFSLSFPHQSEPFCNRPLLASVSDKAADSAPAFWHICVARLDCS